jgi:hypothetical protein
MLQLSSLTDAPSFAESASDVSAACCCFGCSVWLEKVFPASNEFSRSKVNMASLFSWCSEQRPNGVQSGSTKAVSEASNEIMMAAVASDYGRPLVLVPQFFGFKFGKHFNKMLQCPH